MALDNNEFSDQQLVVSDSVKVPSVDGNASGFILCLALLGYIRGRLNKSDVGLGNVDNTSDMDKPVSTAMQEALDDKINKEGIKAVVSDIIADSCGLAVLDGKLCAVYTEE